MRRHRYWILVSLLILCISRVVLAQDDCPTIVQTALQTADQTCNHLGRNQLCYGNITLTAVPQSGVSNFTFQKAGDIVDVGTVQSLTLSSLNAEDNEWGVALMKVQANLPDTLPGQNVTFLLFGDVQVQNAATTTALQPNATAAPTATPTPIVIQVTANNKINVRGTPVTSAPLVSSLPKGQTVQADGRNNAGDWLHVQLSDGSSGWVFAELVTVNGDVSVLPVVSAEVTPSATAVPTEAAPAAPVYGPMQAFYFKTGANDSPCAEAPDSGILIQTPEGAGKVDLTMDGVDVTLGSTVYVQAQPSGDMVITVVEGQATVSAFGITITVPAGTRARIPLDANLTASDVPVGPEGYDAAKLAALPVSSLPKVVTIAPSFYLPSQSWTGTFVSASSSCGTDPGVKVGDQFEMDIEQSTDGQQMIVNSSVIHTRQHDGSYTGQSGKFNYVIHVLAPDHFHLTDKFDCIVEEVDLTLNP